MHTEFISYKEGGQDLEAFVAYPAKEKRPLVILCHSWSGRDDYIMEKAREVAEWGYVGFALDIYGKGVIGKSREENAALKKPFMDDRSKIRSRVTKALEEASELSYVDSSKIAALGFGFGAVSALDLARTGADLKGVITFYGHFDPPPEVKPIKAKILVLHGIHDRVAGPEELKRFQEAMEREGVDWQMHLFGGTAHAFMNPMANDLVSGVVYNSVSANRAWKLTRHFLNDIF